VVLCVVAVLGRKRRQRVLQSDELVLDGVAQFLQERVLDSVEPFSNGRDERLVGVLPVQRAQGVEREDVRRSLPDGQYLGVTQQALGRVPADVAVAAEYLHRVGGRLDGHPRGPVLGDGDERPHELVGRRVVALPLAFVEQARGLGRERRCSLVIDGHVDEVAPHERVLVDGIAEGPRRDARTFASSSARPVTPMAPVAFVSRSKFIISPCA